MVGREEGRREGGGLFKGVPGRRRGAEGATMGKKVRAAFRKASPDAPWVIAPLLGQLFAGWIVPRSRPVEWKSLDALGRPSKI